MKKYPLFSSLLLASASVLAQAQPSNVYQFSPDKMKAATTRLIENNLKLQGATTRTAALQFTAKTSATMGGMNALKAAGRACFVGSWVTMLGCAAAGYAIHLTSDQSTKHLVDPAGTGHIQIVTGLSEPGATYYSVYGYGLQYPIPDFHLNATSFDVALSGTLAYASSYGFTLAGPVTSVSSTIFTQKIEDGQKHEFYANVTPHTGAVPSDAVSTGSFAPAASVLSDAEKNKPINPEVFARLVNEAWQKASNEPGYQGHPYNPAAPITAADVAALGDLPRLGDFLQPGDFASPTPTGSTSPDLTTTPGTPTVPSTETLPDGTTISGGDAPPPVGGENGKEILLVATASFDDWRDINFVLPAGTCPSSYSFQFFSTQIEVPMSSICGTLEALRPFLQTVISFCIVFAGIMRVFSA